MLSIGVILTTVLSFHIFINVQSTPIVDRIELLTHSFDSPLTQENTIREWEFSGAAVATQSNVVVVPPVAERSGYFWHKSPIQTPKFEIEFSFRFVIPRTASTKGFALWYTTDPFDNSVLNENLKTEKSLFGYKSNFNGIAVFFALMNRDNQIRSSVSFAENDGTQTWNVERDVPSNDGIYRDIYRSPPEDGMFKLRVVDGDVVGQVKMRSETQWSQAFKTTLKRPLISEGYVGFSSRTASEISAGGKGGDGVYIDKFHVFDLDVDKQDFYSGLNKASSEEPLTVDAKIDMLREEVHKLSVLLYKHVTEQQPRESIIMKTLNSQMNLIQHIKMEVTDAIKSFHTFSGQSGPHHEATVNMISSEIQGLKSLFTHHTKNSEMLTDSLKTIQEKFGKDGSDNDHRVLAKSMHHHATMSYWIILVILSLFCIFAFVIWRQLKTLEKRHLL